MVAVPAYWEQRERMLSWGTDLATRLPPPAQLPWELCIPGSVEKTQVRTRDSLLAAPSREEGSRVLKEPLVAGSDLPSAPLMSLASELN